MNKETEAQRLARLDREAGARGRVPKTRDENISGKGWFNRLGIFPPVDVTRAELLAALKVLLDYPAGDYSEHGDYGAARDRALALVARVESDAPAASSHAEIKKRVARALADLQAALDGDSGRRMKETDLRSLLRDVLKALDA